MKIWEDFEVCVATKMFSWNLIRFDFNSCLYEGHSILKVSFHFFFLLDVVEFLPTTLYSSMSSHVHRVWTRFYYWRINCRPQGGYSTNEVRWRTCIPRCTFVVVFHRWVSSDILPLSTYRKVRSSTNGFELSYFTHFLFSVCVITALLCFKQNFWEAADKILPF